MKVTFEGEYLYDKDADEAMSRYYALQNINSIEGFKKFILDSIVKNEYDIAILLEVVEKDKSRENEVLKRCIYIYKNYMNDNNNLLILDEFAKLYQKSDIYDENTLKELFNMALNHRNILVILDYIVEEFDKDFVANNYNKLKSLALDMEDKLLLAKHYLPKRNELIRYVLEDADNDEMMYQIYDGLEEIKE